MYDSQQNLVENLYSSPFFLFFRSKLVESEAVVETLKRSSLRTPSRLGGSPMIGVARPMTSASLDTTAENHTADLIEVAKKDLKRLKKKSKRLPSRSQG